GARDGPRLEPGGDASLLPALDDRVEQVRRPADRGRVPQVAGHLAHDRRDAAPARGLALVVQARHAGQAGDAEQVRGPHAEILRAEALAHHLADVGVDVGAAHVHDLACGALELEDLSGMLQQLTDEAGQAPVADLADLALARFPGEVEAYGIASHRDVLGP